MNLGNVEMLSNLLLDEYPFVLMERDPCFIELCKGLKIVRFKVSIIYEIEDCMNSADDLRLCDPDDDAKEDLLYILVFRPCPLCNKQYSLLKVAKSRMGWHGFEPSINLTSARNCSIC